VLNGRESRPSAATFRLAQMVPPRDLSTSYPGATSVACAMSLMLSVPSKCGRSSRLTGCASGMHRRVAITIGPINRWVRPRWDTSSWWLKSATVTTTFAFFQASPSAGVKI
jgi:hypothetical protein